MCDWLSTWINKVAEAVQILRLPGCTLLPQSNFDKGIPNRTRNNIETTLEMRPGSRHPWKTPSSMSSMSTFLAFDSGALSPKTFRHRRSIFGKDLLATSCNRNCIEILNPVIYLCLQAALHWEYEIRRVQSLRAPSRGPIWSKVTAVLSRWLSPRSQRQEPVVSSRSRCVFLPKLMSETLRQRSKFSCWSFRTSFVHSLLASEGLMDNLFAGRSPRIIAFAPCVFTFAEAFQFNIAVSNPCRLITTPPPYIGVLEPSSIRAENFGNTMIRGENGENSFRRENIFCCFLQAMPRQCAASKACAVAVCDEAFSCAGCAPPIPCPIPRSKVTGVLSRFLCKNFMFWKTAARACFSDPCASTSWFSCTEHFFTLGGKKKCEKSHSHSQSLTRSEPTFLWARNVL